MVASTCAVRRSLANWIRLGATTVASASLPSASSVNGGPGYDVPVHACQSEVAYHMVGPTSAGMLAYRGDSCSFTPASRMVVSSTARRHFITLMATELKAMESSWQRRVVGVLESIHDQLSKSITTESIGVDAATVVNRRTGLTRRSPVVRLTAWTAQ